MFNLQPNIATGVRGLQHWIKVDDADELYGMHKLRGASFVSEIEDKPWGAREYVVEDPNGYHLRFAGPHSSATARSQPFPEGVTLQRRKPSHEEYAEVAGKAFDHQNLPQELLEQSWGGAVAISPQGETIGILRIMQDAPGWFSIWDVAVVPQWQARRIGTALISEALQMIEGVSRGAIVYLFTFKHGFYERLGFSKELVSLRRL